MANRRMIAKDVFYADNFTDLPVKTRLLYVYLILSADDDGFLIGVKQALFNAGATQQDIDELTKAGYLTRFESGAYVITHWRRMNTIQSDRYTPTNFTEEAKLLTVTGNKIYMVTECKQDGNKEETQYSIVKDSIVKDSIVKDSIVKDSIVKGNIVKGRGEQAKNKAIYKDINPYNIQNTSIITGRPEEAQPPTPADNAQGATLKAGAASLDGRTEKEAVKVNPGNIGQYFKNAEKLGIENKFKFCDMRRDMIRQGADPAAVDRGIQKEIDTMIQGGVK